MSTKLRCLLALSGVFFLCQCGALQPNLNPQHWKHKLLSSQEVVARTLSKGIVATAAALLVDGMLSRKVANAIQGSHPSKEAIEGVFRDMKYPEDFSEPFNNSEDFKRLDETDDGRFYEPTRFVEHIDAPAVKALTAFQDRVILDAQKRSGSQVPSIDVLDICSSWVSHISIGTPIRTLCGVGMNQIELEKNSKLTSYVVQDLNKRQILPFPNNSFDIAFVQLSIDYLTRPIEVLREIRRVLRGNGALYISFSNRMVFTKAVSIWTSASDLERLEIVGRYLHQAGGFEDIPVAIDLSPSQNSDPLYVVQGLPADHQQLKAAPLRLPTIHLFDA